RAVDQDGEVLDLLVQKRREKHAAERFFCKLLTGVQESFFEIKLHHIFKRRLLTWKQRLCKPHSTAITKNEKNSLVLRSTSFTIRERFTPASACSTLTRMRESARLCRFSPRDNSPLRGFFSAAGSGRLAVHSPESRCPYTRWRCGDSRAPR